MRPVVLLFPGQGAQYVGMGKNLEDQYKNFFYKADEVLGYSLSDICFNGPQESLKLTQNTQPALLTYSVALFHKLKNWMDQRPTPMPIHCVLGHSVGEYAALVAAGSLAFEDAVKLVHLRGKAMQEAVPYGLGKMAAIMRADVELVKKACEASSQGTASVVVPANYNSPDQIVISGHKEAVERALVWLKEQSGGKVRGIELEVSAPFHSPLMSPATEVMKKELAKVSVRENQIPYIANVDAQLYEKMSSFEAITRNLVDQVAQSVLWLQSVAKLPDHAVCIEVGPGKVLKGLMGKIRPDMPVVTLENENVFTELGELL